MHLQYLPSQYQGSTGGGRPRSPCLWGSRSFSRHQPSKFSSGPFVSKRLGGVPGVSRREQWFSKSSSARRPALRPDCGGRVNAVFRINSYAMVSLATSIMIIGGNCDANESSQIAKYTLSSNSWSNAGSLLVARQGHRAIINGNRIHVIGGNYVR